MTAAYTNGLADKVHNQSIEIKRLKAELERVRKEAQEAVAVAQAEVGEVQKSLRKIERKAEFYKGKFLLLKKEIEQN